MNIQDTIQEKESKIAQYKEDCLEKVKDILWVVFRIQDIDASKTFMYINEGLNICKKLNLPIQKHKLLAYQGAMYEKEYRLEDALDKYAECADYFKKTNDEWMYSNMLDSIAGIYSNTNRKQEAFELYRQVIKLCKKNNKPDELFLGLINLATLSLELRRFKLMKKYFAQMLSIQSSLTFMAASAPIYIQYYTAKFELISKNYQKAIQSIEEAIQYCESKIEYQFEKTMCLTLKIEIHYYQRNLEAMLSDICEIRNIKSVSVTTYLREALTTLYNYYERTKNYKLANETLKELFHIRESEFINKKLTETTDKITNTNSNLASNNIHIQDIQGIMKRIEQNDITHILYDNRILKIYQTDETTILKQGSLSDFIAMLQSQNIVEIVKISRTEAVNLFYMDSYNSTTKELILDVFGIMQKFQVSQRQEKFIKNYRL